jgi:bifunctional N-acetylglucosamine-1-phosphate-uridyltransferase/glucosamine-1-phosphate-acetyltransferase GlmU-like protein
MRPRRSSRSAKATPACSLRRRGCCRAGSASLSNDNAQREYYLTDIVAMAVADKVKVEPLIAPTLPEVLGINDRLQLAEVEAHLRCRAYAR